MKLKLSPHPCGTIFWLICPQTLTNLPGLCKLGSPPSGFLNHSMIPRNIANCRGHLPEWQTDRLSANKKPLQTTVRSSIHWTWLGQRVHVFTAWFLSPLPKGTDFSHRLVRKPEQWKWPLSLNLRPSRSQGAPTTAPTAVLLKGCAPPSLLLPPHLLHLTGVWTPRSLQTSQLIWKHRCVYVKVTLSGRLQKVLRQWQQPQRVT